MVNLSNCSRCGKVFARNLRDICQDCYREEEEAYKTVYKFLSKRKNREATLDEIVDATDVDEELIIKFIKENRLRSSQFPKLAYPCERCGIDIVEGRLCHNCSQDIIQQVERHDELEKRSKEREERMNQQKTYYSFDSKQQNKKR